MFCDFNRTEGNWYVSIDMAVLLRNRSLNKVCLYLILELNEELVFGFGD